MELQPTLLAVQPPTGPPLLVRSRVASARERNLEPSAPKTAPKPTPTPSPAIEVLLQRRQAITPSGLRLSIDETVDRVIAQIVNANNEVIKQIPPEEAVRAFARFREVTGLIFDLEI